MVLPLANNWSRSKKCIFPGAKKSVTFFWLFLLVFGRGLFRFWEWICYNFPEGQTTEFEYSWEWLYGKLPAGTYRLEKEFMDFRKTADFDKAMYWVEFEISE